MITETLSDIAAKLCGLTRFILGPVVVAMVRAAAPALAQVPAGPGGSAQALRHRPVCGPPASGTARCHAEVVSDGFGAPLATTGYAGDRDLGPVGVTEHKRDPSGRLCTSTTTRDCAT